MTSRIATGTAVLLLLALGSGSAIAEEPPAPEAGAIAPENCWPCEGGSPAGTGQTATKALRGPLQAAWQVEFGGKEGVVESAPVVWRNLVILSVRVDVDKRRLHVLNLHDGKPAARKRTIKSREPLRPCVWGETILVCKNRRVLEAYRVRGGGLRSAGSLDVGDSVRHFFLFEDHAYAVADGRVVCWRVGATKPEWHRPGTFRGRPALRGDDLLAVSYDSEGNAHLQAFERRSGRSGARLFVGHHGGLIPSGDDPLHVVAHKRYVFVHHARSVKADGGPVQCTWVRRKARPGASSALEKYRTLAALRPVAVIDDLVVALIRSEKKGKQILRLEEVKPEEWGQVILADEREHGDLIDADRSYAVAGRVLHMGGTSFDLDDYQIRWEHMGRIAQGPVPARDTLLLVTPNHHLVALRSERAAQATPLWFGAARSAAEAAPSSWTGTVLFVDGTSFTGPFTRSADAASISFEPKPKKTERRPIGDVRAIVGSDGHLLYSASLEGTPGALGALVRAQGAKAVLALANDSTKSFDTDLMGRLADEAEARGIPGRRLTRVRKRITALRKKPKPVKPDRVAALEKKLAEQTKAETSSVAAAMERGIDDERPAVRRSFLDALLRTQPDHPRVAELVRGMVPEILEVPETFDPDAWLHLADALRRVKLERVVPPKPGERNITGPQRELGAAKSYWREDLVGLLGEEFLLVTPLDKPRALGDVLMMAQLVSSTLEEIFGGLPSVREKRLPLTIQFFAEQGAFRDVSLKGGSGTGRKRLRSWEVSYHSGGDHLTRVLATPKPRLRDWALRSFATSLTWHWMDQRCPLFRESEMKWDREGAGYWAIVGMAKWMREIDWNIEKGTYRTLDRKARSIDMVANAPADRLRPWPIFFATSQGRWREIPYKPGYRVPMRWTLGFNTIANPSDMFDAQAAATCYYLHHMGGSWRKNLLEIIRDVHTGKIGRDSSYIEKRFHMSPDALGKRIVQWARDVQSGKKVPGSSSK